MEAEGVDADNGRSCIDADARVHEAVSKCDGGEEVALDLAGVPNLSDLVPWRAWRPSSWKAQPQG